jgi:hypothetical protein
MMDSWQKSILAMSEAEQKAAQESLKTWENTYAAIKKAREAALAD